MVKLYEMSIDMKYSGSPFVIFAKMCLKHKGIDFESIPLDPSTVRPTIMEITNGEWGQVPTTIFDNGDIVYDSDKIASYLDEKYSSKTLKNDDPSLDALLAQYQAMSIPAMRIMCGPFFDNMSEDQKVWFKPYFEGRLGYPLEQFISDDPQLVLDYKKSLDTLEAQLQNQPFFQGEQPGYYDYRIFSHFQSFRCMSEKTFNSLVDAKDHPKLNIWLDSILDLHNGFARSFDVNPN